MNFLIIGGSKRSETLFKKLIESGLKADLIVSLDQLDANKSYDCIVLPIPTLTREKTLNFDTDKKINPEEFLNTFNDNPLIISCNYTNPAFNITDLNKRDDFAYLNAIPTAEGAISIAIEAMDSSLSLSKVAVLGFGHVGKILANKLKGFGSEVTIIARSNKDIYLAKTTGYETVHISNLKEQASDFDVFFQTIPAPVLDKNILDGIKKESIIIELSSRAIGSDVKYAESIGKKVINAPSLPERTAPITAGNVLFECIMNVINEQSKGV